MKTKRTKSEAATTKKTLKLKSGVKAGPHFKSYDYKVFHYQGVGQYQMPDSK